MKKAVLLIFVMLVLQACAPTTPSDQKLTLTIPASPYLNYSGRDDVLSGGVKLIPITTPKGVFHVWTKQVGNNPTIKVLSHMEMKKVQKGRYLFCPNGSHMALYDDQKTYVEGLIKFILDVDRGEI